MFEQLYTWPNTRSASGYTRLCKINEDVHVLLVPIGLTLTGDAAVSINLEKTGHKVYASPLSSQDVHRVFDLLKPVTLDLLSLAPGTKGPLCTTLAATSSFNLAFTSPDVVNGGKTIVKWF